jgi:methyl-accepting chemotaxis protein
MPIVHLEPGDLSPDQAQRVLDFLNAATSAQQLDRDIEFPGEPDIGVRLGQRLLDAREALGGRFTQITQVRAVRLIGPDRFTEICVAALGFTPQRWVELFYGGAPMTPQAETWLSVAIELRPQPAWLGQPLSLTVHVRDRGGSARMGVPVAVHTGVGRLVAMYGFSRIEGAAITVITGADGSADLELFVPPSEPLSEIQQSALEHALGGLDASAPDPQKLAAGFAKMVETYLQERSYNLRRAVDVWVRDQREAMVDSLNATRWAFAWPVTSALLQADALAADGGGGTLARAVATPSWKNWVGAWLLALDQHLQRSGQIDQALAAASRGADGKVLGQLLGQAQRFVASQPGLVAEWLGRKQVQTAVQRLVSSDLSGLDATARADVLTQLETAAREVRPTSLGSFTLVSQARQSLVKDIGQIGQFNAAQLAQLQGLAGEIDRKAAAIDAQAQQIATLASTVQNDRQFISEQLDLFNQQRGQLAGQIGEFSALASQFQQTSRTVAAQVAQFNTDLAGFQRSSVQLNTRLESLQTDLLDVNRRIAPLLDVRVGVAPAGAAAPSGGSPPSPAAAARKRKRQP